MGASWSRWLEGEEVFRKERFVDAASQRSFYVALKQAVVLVDRANAEERIGAEPPDEQTLRQVEYVLENWAREVGALYDRVGDFPLIFPMPNELEASGTVFPRAESGSVNSSPLTRDEAALSALCSDRYATSDATYTELQRVTDGKNEVALFSVLHKYPRAARLFVSQRLHAWTDAATPFRMFESNGEFTQAAMLVGRLAYGEESFVKKRKRLQEMSKLLARAHTAQSTKEMASVRIATSFELAMTDEMLALMDTQNRLENRLGVMYLVGSSLIETIHKLLTMYPTYPDALGAAVIVAEEFNVQPRQFWWAVLTMFARAEQWSSLCLLAAVVPPPFGYVPIAEALVERRRLDLAQDLLALIAAPAEREAVATYLATCGMPQDDTPVIDNGTEDAVDGA